MEQSSESITNSSVNIFCSNENPLIAKEYSDEYKNKDINCLLNDNISKKQNKEESSVEVQNDSDAKNTLEQNDCVNDNSDLSSNGTFSVKDENEVHATINKLLDMLIKNIDDTEPIKIDSSETSQSSSNNMVAKREISDNEDDIQIIESIDLTRKKRENNGPCITVLPDNLSEGTDDEIMIISPIDEKQNDSSEVDIFEKITETKSEKCTPSSIQENISSQCDSNPPKNDNIVNSNKSSELNEPLNMTLPHVKEAASASCLKNLLQQKIDNLESKSFEPCLKDEKTLNESSNDTQKAKSIEKLIGDEIGFPAFLEDFVTIGNFAPVTGDFTLKGEESLIDCPSLVTPFLVKQPDKFPSSESKIPPINPNFFDTSIGDFLLRIGFNRVSEWYHRDMAKIKSHRIKSSGKTEELAQELRNHQGLYLQAKKENEPFVFPPKTCPICNYSTESSLVLEGHLSIPHVTSRREYQCNYCSYLHRDSKTILDHMKQVHNKIGFIDNIYSGYECPCCIFETNSRPKLHTHVNKCSKYFNHSKNQAPTRDFEFPCLTPKPITVNIVKSYEKSISGNTRGRPTKPMEQDYGQPQVLPYANQAPNLKNFQLKNVLSDGILNQMYANVNAVNSYHSGMPSVQRNSHNYLHNTNATMPNVSQLHSLHLPKRNKAFKTMNSNTFDSSSFYRPDDYNKIPTKLPSAVPQLPSLQGAFQLPVTQEKLSSNTSSSHNLVVCEICDGYIKDLEQLRMHMQLIHKVKINPKMLSSRPPLNCQKCFWRFFTDHGLERHLLGSHGLVTSNMQELADKNKDAGCCTLCGKVYPSKLVAHMNQMHKIALKPANLSYKCTVCSATFGLYRLFESHVYLVHAAGSKRSSSGDNPVSRKSIKLNSPC